MNIVQMHFKTEFFLDSVRSPRFNIDKMDNAINSAINDIVLDRYHNIRAQPKEYAFQTSQRLRDELSRLVKKATVSASGGILPSASFPADYMLLLSLKANISGQWINTIPVTYDELNVLEMNPYTNPSISPPERIYRIEDQLGLRVIFGDIGDLISGEMNYIAKPVTVSIGTEVSPPSGAVTSISGAGVVIIAYVNSSLNWITPDGGASFTLKAGESYTIGTNSETSVSLTSGIVFKNPTNTDLPELLHEEICRKAAKILSGNVENYDRDVALGNDIKNTEN